MSSPLTAKRRKLNESSNALKKPFVSPLKTSTIRTAKQNGNAATTTTPYQPSTLAHSTVVHNHDNTPTRHTKLASTPTRPNPLRKPNTFPTSILRRSTADPAEKAAQRALTSLELRIRTVRNELDSLKQAARLSTSTTDADLEVLTQKWKRASQNAAEELFGSVKERINRMGGVQAWRDAERAKMERKREWADRDQKAVEEQGENDDECYVDAEGNDLPEDEVEWRLKEKERMKKEREEAAQEDDRGQDDGGEGEGRKKEVWEEDGRDDDSFTMDMMLRMMGVDLKLVGWDMDEQRWVV